jgi:hypothetical protein
MTTLVLDAQQSRLVSTEFDQVRVVDENGREIGFLLVNPSNSDPPPVLTVKQIEELARRIAEPVGDWPTTAEVIQRIKARVAR